MADIKWIKITTNIFDDEKIKLIETLPERDGLIVIWFKLLTLAGKVNDNGSIYISKKMATTDEMLATIFNRPLNVIRLALETFVNFDMIDIEDHINIVNWDKHQNIEGMEKIRLQNLERQRKMREKKKLQQIEHKSNVMSRDSHATEEDKNKIRIDKDKDKDKEKHLYFENLELNDIFVEFLELRKSLKAKNTERAIKLLLNTLEGYEESEKISIIERSIMNSWKSLFPKDKGGKSGNKKNERVSGGNGSNYSVKKGRELYFGEEEDDE